MSRIYICDKCHAAFKIWSTKFVEEAIERANRMYTNKLATERGKDILK
jgi:hypothetical protein